MTSVYSLDGRLLSSLSSASRIRCPQLAKVSCLLLPQGPVYNAQNPYTTLLGPAFLRRTHTISRHYTTMVSGSTPDVKAPQEASPSDTLRVFLRRTKTEYLEAVHNGRGKEWTVVMGNEAGDLDSLASAIAYAWYLSQEQQSPSVALVQTPRGDLHLRAENAHALALAGLSFDDLLCMDDASPSESTSLPFPSTTFALVDHNRLSAQFSVDNSDARVVAIIDHHADEGLHTEANPRIVTQGIGSCAALVASFLQDKCPEHIPRELAMLLLSAIIIDTGGMTPGGKAVEVDQRAAAFLASRCTLAPTDPAGLSLAPESSSDAIPPLHESPVIQQLNATLQTKKNSVAHLGVRDLLRRDYKEYALTPAFAPSRELLIGLASVPLGLAAFVPRDEAQFVRDTRGWMDERGLSALGVLTSFRDEKKAGKSGKGKHRREQLWIVRARDDAPGEHGGELARRLFHGLEGSEDLRLKKRKWEKIGMEPAVWDRSGGAFAEGWRVKAWKQKNTDATRKATAPIVKAIVEGRGV
ncbi:uncharacterized protein B0H18DRAFT_989417 [Fomitopsis serialis]|uniref:uncharacterized protein n=1 Tax=Fomitopsis serialis TaxID=139415 RepID=UPI002008AC7E|nr:uncharacterized protein B0H18DRAFT_989417 [Neoantrodia serialis]KAH9931452.1 hypothetical protein B0H18DRAFT_989417 [Neoantrodia serialis]